MPRLIAVAGPAGGGKTTWISQFLQTRDRPQYYACPGSAQGIDAAYLGYRFPWVQLIPEATLPAVLAELPTEADVYMELGFHLSLEIPLLTVLPWQRVALLPPGYPPSDWADWADTVVPGQGQPPAQTKALPHLWRTTLTGRVFDPSSLDLVWTEIIQGAYGSVQRAKGIFELPDGRAFYVDFVQGLAGSEYGELPVTPWLQGHPDRPSRLEVVGWDLDPEAIAPALLDSCLSDDLLAQYQAHYRSLIPA